MVTSADIESSLRDELSPAFYSCIPQLAQVLYLAATDMLTPEVLRQQLTTQPALAPLLAALAGQQIIVQDFTFSFERTAQAERAVGTPDNGDVTINARRLNGSAFTPSVVDMRRGVFISGGVVHGAVVGFNEGTINHTEVTVNIDHGSMLNPADDVTLVRCAPPQPPLPLRRFYDRAEPLDAIQQELQTGHGAWLTGPLGCGNTALLHQAANLTIARSFADGVLYVDGMCEAHDLDDLVQSLYNAFYMSARGVVVHRDRHAACAELSHLRALFVLDRLWLTSDHLVALSNTLACTGAVLVAAESPAPDTLLDLPIAGLPDADACKLFATEAHLNLEHHPEDTVLVARLCAALGYLPLPLILVARLIRCESLPLAEVVSEIDHLNSEREPLARAVQLVLHILCDAEQAVLAALIAGGGYDADLDVLIHISQLPFATVEDALLHMQNLRLVQGEHERYAVTSCSLRRVLARMLSRDEARRRAAAYFAGAATQHQGDLNWLRQERLNLLATARTALQAGQATQTGQLAHAIQPYLVLKGLWGSWAQAIDMAEQAAQANGDLSLRAWALHERGTRAGLLHDLTSAAANLSEARRLRLELGDQAGADATLHNMEYLKLVPPPPPPPTDSAPPAPPPEFPRFIFWIAVTLAVMIGVAGIGMLLWSSLFPPTPPAPPAPALVETQTATPTFVVAPTATPVPTFTVTPPSPTPPPTDTPPPPPPTNTPTPVAVISIYDVEVAEGYEGTTAAIFSVVLSSASANPVTVEYYTEDASATLSDYDYLATSGTLIFDPGQTSQVVTVLVVGDPWPEPDEAFFLGLQNPVNATLADGRAGVGRILNDDVVTPTLPDISFVEPGVSVGEGDAVVLMVSLSAPSDQRVSVDYATQDASAVGESGSYTGVDYASASDTLIFNPGETIQAITIQTFSDWDSYEGDEAFDVILSNPINAVIADGQAAVTIRNIVPQPYINIESAVSVYEGSVGKTEVVLMVELLHTSDQTVTVYYGVTDGTASALDDYDYIPITIDQLTFVPGTTSQTITVQVIGDEYVEEDETFYVYLIGPVNATLGNDQATVTILNDDIETAPILRSPLWPVLRLW